MMNQVAPTENRWRRCLRHVAASAILLTRAFGGFTPRHSTIPSGDEAAVECTRNQFQSLAYRSPGRCLEPRAVTASRKAQAIESFIVGGVPSKKKKKRSGRRRKKRRKKTTPTAPVVEEKDEGPRVDLDGVFTFMCSIPTLPEVTHGGHVDQSMHLEQLANATEEAAKEANEEMVWGEGNNYLNQEVVMKDPMYRTAATAYKVANPELPPHFPSLIRPGQTFACNIGRNTGDLDADHRAFTRLLKMKMKDPPAVTLCPIKQGNAELLAPAVGQLIKLESEGQFMVCGFGYDRQEAVALICVTSPSVEVAEEAAFWIQATGRLHLNPNCVWGAPLKLEEGKDKNMHVVRCLVKAANGHWVHFVTQQCSEASALKSARSLMKRNGLTFASSYHNGIPAATRKRLKEVMDGDEETQDSQKVTQRNIFTRTRGMG